MLASSSSLDTMPANFALNWSSSSVCPRTASVIESSCACGTICCIVFRTSLSSAMHLSRSALDTIPSSKLRTRSPSALSSRAAAFAASRSAAGTISFKCCVRCCSSSSRPFFSASVLSSSDLGTRPAIEPLSCSACPVSARTDSIAASR